MTSYFQDGDHDVISRRKVLPSGECTRSVSPRTCRASARSWSSYCTFVYSILVLYGLLSEPATDRATTVPTTLENFT